MSTQDRRALLSLARDLQRAAIDSLPPCYPVATDTVALFDALVTEPELRDAVRQLFLDGHYPQAVEEGFKYLNNLVKSRTALSADGAPLMTTAFSPAAPLLKLSDLKSQSKHDQQLGYMKIFEGSMTGIRNPRAHEHKYLDDPRNALELLALCNHLTRLAVNATRGRRRRSRAAKT